MPDDLRKILADHLVTYSADRLAVRAFMLVVALYLAEEKRDPEAWVQSFIGLLHGTMDNLEAALGDAALATLVPEKARQMLDLLGRDLRAAMTEDDQSSS